MEEVEIEIGGEIKKIKLKNLVNEDRDYYMTTTLEHFKNLETDKNSATHLMELNYEMIKRMTGLTREQISKVSIKSTNKLITKIRNEVSLMEESEEIKK